MKSKGFYIEPRKELIWVAVDLDKTLAEQIWPDPGIGDPIAKNVVKLHELVNHGYKIIIHTSRHWSDQEMIKKWLILNDIPFNQIICGKLLVHRIIDDKAVNSESPSWL